MPAATLAPPAIARRRSRTAVRAGRRSGRIGLVLGGIVDRVPARVLLARPERRASRRRATTSRPSSRSATASTPRPRTCVTNIQRLGSGPAIRKEALDAGLTPLAAPIVVPAR